MPGGPYAHPLQADGNPRRSCFRGVCTWVHNGLITLRYVAFLARPEGFEQAQSHIALRRILLRYERHLLSQDGEIERPVDEQEDLADLASPRQVGEEQPGGKSKAKQRLHALDRDDKALQPEGSTHPLDEQAFVLTPYGSLCRVDTHCDKAQERIQIEATQGTGMAAHTQVTLRQKGLRCQWQTHAERHCQCRQRRARRIKPGNPCCGQDKFED